MIFGSRAILSPVDRHILRALGGSRASQFVQKPDHVRKGSDVRIDRTASLDARGVATYLQQLSQSDLNDGQVEQLKQLTNQLESRLYGDDKLEEEAAYLLTLAGLFQRRYELTGEDRALKARQELLARAQKILNGVPR